MLKFYSKRLLVFTTSTFGILALMLGCTLNKKKTEPQRIVNLAIWSNYISRDLIKEFETRTQIKVQISNFSSNEELLAKMQAGGTGYDVVLPSDYMIYGMRQLGLLKPLDMKLLPHAKGVDPKYLKKSYDPLNQYSIPYDWGTTALAINRKLYPGPIKSWKEFFSREDLKQKISLLDDAREVLGAALRSLGYSFNSKNPKELDEAKALLLKFRHRVKSFTSEALMPIVNEEVAVAQCFMTDALLAQRRTTSQIDYILPTEGNTLWIDSIVMPASSSHVQEAYALMDFLLEPRTNLYTVTTFMVAPVQPEVFQLLPPEIQKNPGLFPSDAAIQKMYMVEDIGDSLVQVDRIWTEIKAQ